MRCRLFFSVLLYAALASAQAGGPVPSGNTVAPSTPRFKDIAPQAGLSVAHISSPEKRYIIESVSGGIGLFDCDNDGKLDIVAVNGSNVDRYRAQGGDQMITLYHKVSDLKFTDITRQAVSKAADLDDIPLESRRGAAFGDINNDGCVDIVVLNVGAPPSLLLNHCQNGNHRVLFQLLATKSNRLAIGARVSARTGKLMQMSEVKGGSSYISQSDLRSRRPNRGIRAVSTISFVTLAETFASPKSHRK